MPSKSETRKPRSEGNPKSEVRNPKGLYFYRLLLCQCGFGFGFRISDFLRISVFGVRISGRQSCGRRWLPEAALSVLIRIRRLLSHPPCDSGRKDQTLAMNNAQLELSFGNRRVRRSSSVNRRPSIHNPQWWFQRMRQIVDCALDWQPAPQPRPEQILFPHKDFRSWTA